MKNKNATNLVVCKLVGAEFQERKALLQKEIFRQVMEVKESSDGYSFYFTDTGDFLVRLVDLMLAEQKCCPFFDFDLSVKSYNRGIEWKISGEPEVKEMIKSLVED